MKFYHYYKHKTKQELIMVHGFELNSNETRCYITKLSILCPYSHVYGLSVEYILENYNEYNP